MWTKWLVIGGAATLGYLIFTGKGLRQVLPGGKAQPQPQGPPAQKPLPPAQPQTTVVPGAGASVLEDAQKAAAIVGTLADAAKKLGLFGSSDETPAPTAAGANADPVGIQRNQDSPTFGAAFF